MKASSQIEHPVCKTCIFPVPPGAEFGYNPMSDGRFLDLYFAVGGPTAAETAAMYKAKLQGLGWQITQEEASGDSDLPGYTYSITDGTHKFTVRVGTSNMGPGKNQTQIEIAPDPPFPPPTPNIDNTGQFEHTACQGCIFPAPPGSTVFPGMMGDNMMEVHCPETMSAEEVITWYRTKLPEFGWKISKDESKAGTHTYLVGKDGRTFRVLIMGSGNEHPVQVDISLE